MDRFGSRSASRERPPYHRASTPIQVSPFLGIVCCRKRYRTCKIARIVEESPAVHHGYERVRYVAIICQTGCRKQCPMRFDLTNILVVVRQ